MNIGSRGHLKSNPMEKLGVFSPKDPWYVHTWTWLPSEVQIFCLALIFFFLKRINFNRFQLFIFRKMLSVFIVIDYKKRYQLAAANCKEIGSYWIAYLWRMLLHSNLIFEQWSFVPNAYSLTIFSCYLNLFFSYVSPNKSLWRICNNIRLTVLCHVPWSFCCTAALHVPSDELKKSNTDFPCSR